MKPLLLFQAIYLYNLGLQFCFAQVFEICPSVSLQSELQYVINKSNEFDMLKYFIVCSLTLTKY